MSSEPTPNPEAESYTDERWHFRGRRIDSKGGFAYVYAPEEHANDESAGLWFAKPLVSKHVAVGNVIAVSVTRKPREGGGESCTVKGGGKDTFAKAPPEIRNRWIAADEAAETIKAREARSKRASDDASLKALLAPIRAEYHNTRTHAARAALLGAVIEAITGWKAE